MVIGNTSVGGKQPLKIGASAKSIPTAILSAEITAVMPEITKIQTYMLFLKSIVAA
jgi:hypothetical protein